MKNWFYKKALATASRLAGKPGRIVMLLTQLGIKIYQTDFKALKAVHLLEKMKVLSRMTTAYAKGHYRDLPWSTLLRMIAAMIYFVNPFDLVPDALPGLGLTDDFTVLLWVYGSAQLEIEKFLEWEGKLGLLPIVVGHPETGRPTTE